MRGQGWTLAYGTPRGPKLSYCELFLKPLNSQTWLVWGPWRVPFTLVRVSHPCGPWESLQFVTPKYMLMCTVCRKRCTVKECRYLLSQKTVNESIPSVKFEKGWNAILLKCLERLHFCVLFFQPGWSFCDFMRGNDIDERSSSVVLPSFLVALLFLLVKILERRIEDTTLSYSGDWIFPSLSSILWQSFNTPLN